MIKIFLRDELTKEDLECIEDQGLYTDDIDLIVTGDIELEKDEDTTYPKLYHIERMFISWYEVKWFKGKFRDESNTIGIVYH